MIIGIDGNEANIKNRVGVNQYASELLFHLEKLPEAKNHQFIIYLQKPPLPHLPQSRPGWEYKILSGGRFWILKKLMPHLLFTSKKPDIFFSPSHYTPPFLSMPSVISIMDLDYLNSPDQFKKYDYYQLKHWGALSMRNAKKIIAISESTKSEIIKAYKWASGKVEVTLLGYDEEKYNKKINKTDILKVKHKYGINNEYILFLSTLKPNKNIEGLIDGFNLMSNKDLQLVIAGKKGWLYESIFEKVKFLKLDDRVIFTDFIPEEDKAPLMAGSSVFALTSFWEGFGIPVLEAMACGIPVVVSKVGSLPEVVGDAGIYVDPRNPSDIAKGLARAFLSNQIFSKKSLLQVEKFSWVKTARKTLDILVDAS